MNIEQDKSLDQQMNEDADYRLMRNIGAVAGVASVGVVASGAIAAAQNSDVIANKLFYDAASAYGVVGANIGASVGLAVSELVSIGADVASIFITPLLGYERKKSDLREHATFTAAGAVIGGSIGAATGMALEQGGEGLYWLVTKLS
jgi:hypothetical protein